MYKIANDKAQNAARRLTLAQLQSDGIEVTPEMEYAASKAALAQLETRLASATGRQREELIQEKMALQVRLGELRAIVKALPRKIDLAECFFAVVKESVTKAQYGVWIKMARTRFEDAQRAGAANEANPRTELLDNEG